MSAQASDSNFIAFNLSSQDKFEQNQNVYSLSEVSRIGKIWDKHRANTDKVLHYYAKADEDYFQQYAWRMRMCSELLKFQLVPDESEGILKLKLLDARFCRIRHCPVCQWRRDDKAIKSQNRLGKITMTNPKPIRTVRRGRIFPDIQWSEEKKAQWKAEQEAFYQRCKVIFDRVQPELIKSHHNWYVAVEPESGDYFTDKDELAAIHKSRQQHPNTPVFIFRINETGIAGTI